MFARVTAMVTLALVGALPADATSEMADPTVIDHGIHLPPDLRDDLLEATEATEATVDPYGFERMVSYRVASFEGWRIMLTYSAAATPGFRSRALVAADRLTQATGNRFDVTTGSVPSSTSPGDGEIVVHVGTTHLGSTSCGGLQWAGCGGPTRVRSVDGFGEPIITAGALTVHQSSANDRFTQSILEHELGHVLGLGHFSEMYLGEYQLMHPIARAEPGYRYGDRRGLRSATSVVPTCDGRPATLWGSPHDDVLIGDGANDVIVGFGGDDLIFGGAGDDVVCGGDGADDITGGTGRDTLYGEAGNDAING